MVCHKSSSKRARKFTDTCVSPSHAAHFRESERTRAGGADWRARFVHRQYAPVAIQMASAVLVKAVGKGGGKMKAISGEQ